MLIRCVSLVRELWGGGWRVLYFRFDHLNSLTLHRFGTSLENFTFADTSINTGRLPSRFYQVLQFTTKKINSFQQKVLQNNVCRKNKKKIKEAYKEIRTNVAFLPQAMYLRCGRRIKVISLQYHSIPIWSLSKSQWNRAQPVFPIVSIQIYLSHKLCVWVFRLTLGYMQYMVLG